MARFLVKASEFKNVCKAVNDRKLAELKKEIIEILKKQDEKDVKKAIDYFNSQEGHYTHLEKSLISGKWIQKAGYGVGTVRIWKGKKYKKIAPGKWARVFDKEGRGTNIAIGKLIARVQKIDNIEDLMAFVMQNKQRFVDENGIDLPVLDKLRAYADDRSSKLGQGNNYADMESNVVNERNKIADKEHKQNVKESNAIMDESNRKHYEAALKEVEDAIDNAGDYDDIEELEKERKQLLKKLGKKPAEKKTETKEVPFGGVDKNDEGEGVEALSMADKINEVAEKGQLKVGNTTYKVDKDGKEWAVRTEIMNAVKCKEGIDRINDEFEKKAKPKLEAELKEKLDKIKEKLPEIVKEGKLEENKKLVEERLKRYSEGASEGLTIDAVISNHKKDVINKLENHVKDNELFTQKNTDEIELLGNVDHQVELCSINTSAVFYAECKKLLDEYSEEESEADKPSKKEEKQYKETKKMLEDKIAEFDKQLKMFDNNPNENTKRLSKDVEKQKKTYVKMLENLESEYEKTQNRSEAMKGNQNAKKWGLSDEDLNKMRDIQVKVEEKFKKEYPKPMSEYSETSKKNEIISELGRRTKDPEIRKLAIKLRGFDGMLPDEYLESNTKRLDEMIRDRTLKNAGNMRNAIAWEISGMNDYWRSHIDSHQAYALTEYEALANLLEKNSGEIDADGKRYISSALDVLREMKDVYASDYYRKYDDSLPHDEKMEDLIERYTKLAEEYGNGVNKQTEPEQPKPNQESAAAPDEDITESKAKKHRSIPAFEPVKSAAEKKENIAKTTKIEEGKVSIPATREIKNEIKNLLATAAKKSNVLNDARREFLAHVYYDGENLITTDGKKMKVIKIGEIDGIEPNKYIEIDTTGKDDIILKQDEKDYGFYPNYKRVIPDGNKQQIKFDNNALKDKIDEMKKDGSIDLETRRISLKLRDGSVYLDNTRVGDAKDVSFENGKDYITFDYSLLTNALSGDESIMAVSDDPTRAVSISTKVSDNVFMPMVSSDEVDYAKNREVRAAEEEAQAKKQAQDATDAENRKRRNLTNEAKSEILKDKPEGVTDSDYEDLIDYTNDFYVNLGYDNSTPRAKAEIKRTIDNAINQINNKDYAIFDMIQNSDNKVSRKIFETITALKLGSNRESAKKAWESWVGKEGVENHKKQVEAEQKQREENEKNEKLNRINSRIDQVSKYNGNISDDRKNVVRDYLLNLKVKKDEPTYRALFGNYKYKPNDDSEYITNNGVNFVFDKLKNNGIEYFEKYYTSIKDKPMLNFARYVNATMNSENVKKALFDSFLVDNILTMDIDDLEEDEENESLFNDYSAEQPDLFNSTEMKVQEAFNRCGCCL